MQLSLFKDKKLLYLAIAIILIFLLAPFSIFNYSFITLTVITVFTIFFLSKNKGGAIAIIFAYSLIVPYASSKVGTGATNYISYISISAAVFYYLIIGKKNPIYKVNYFIPILLGIIGLLHAISNDSIEELRLLLFYLLSTYAVFYIALLDKFDFLDWFKIFDIIFYCTISYVILEVFFQYSPYSIIYEDQLLDIKLRAKGLLGQPLILSGFLTFYLISIFIKAIIFKKSNIIIFIITLFSILLTASKTGIILSITAVLIYIILKKYYLRFQFYITLLSLLFVGIFIIPLIINTNISIALERISSSSFDQRMGSYPVAIDVFSNNWAGIGLSKDALRNEIKKTGIYKLNGMYDSTFLVFDNTYLTLLTSYGVFSVLMYYVYFIPLLYFPKRKKSFSNKCFQASLLLLVIWLLQNLSFDTYVFFPINAFYFILAACIIKEDKKQEILN